MKVVDEAHQRDSGIEAIWAATNVQSGRFDPVQSRTPVVGLWTRLEALRARGEGYLEVRRGVGEFPLLTLGFRGSEAVVQAFRSMDDVCILEGARSDVPAEVVIPILDDEVAFAGWARQSFSSACDAIEAFVKGAPLDSLGQWIEL